MGWQIGTTLLESFQRWKYFQTHHHNADNSSRLVDVFKHSSKSISFPFRVKQIRMIFSQRVNIELRKRNHLFLMRFSFSSKRLRSSRVRMRTFHEWRRRKVICNISQINSRGFFCRSNFNVNTRLENSHSWSHQLGKETNLFVHLVTKWLSSADDSRHCGRFEEMSRSNKTCFN